MKGKPPFTIVFLFFIFLIYLYPVLAGSFGFDGVGTSWSDINDIIMGNIAKLIEHQSGTITADNITTKITFSGCFKAAIYNYPENTTVGTTEEKCFIPSDEWVTFELNSPKPTLINDTEYYLVIWGNQTGGSGPYVKSTWQGGHKLWYQSETYGNFPSPISPTFDLNYIALIYSNYTVSAADVTNPHFSDDATNTTVAGQPVNFSIIIHDETAVDSYIFSTNNTGNWINASAVATGGSVQELAYNIITLNSTVGVLVQWCVYANDTSNNWNTTSCDDPFTLTTTSGAPPPATATTIQAGATINPVNQYQNTTIWCDYRNASDNTRITGATVKINTDGSNITIPYNSSSSRYDYVYNSTTLGTKQIFCYANKTGYESNSINFNLVTKSISPGQCGWYCEDWSEYIKDEDWTPANWPNSTSQTFDTCGVAGCEETYWFRKYITPPSSVNNFLDIHSSS